jgi:hypothetical protein
MCDLVESGDSKKGAAGLILELLEHNSNLCKVHWQNKDTEILHWRDANLGERILHSCNFPNALFLLYLNPQQTLFCRSEWGRNDPMCNRRKKLERRANVIFHLLKAARGLHHGTKSLENTNWPPPNRKRVAIGDPGQAMKRNNFGHPGVWL